MLPEIISEKTKTAPLKIFADGKESYFEKEILNITIVPTGEQISKTIGHVIILRNVTPYKELDFAKTNFIATVSHELKTPISSIQMSLQLLRNEKIGGMNSEQKSLLESINEDAARLLKITAELLDMTQVESGKIQLAIIPTGAKEMLLYAVNANKTQADQKQIKLEINCPDALPKVLVFLSLSTSTYSLALRDASVSIGEYLRAPAMVILPPTFSTPRLLTFHSLATKALIASRTAG